MTRHAYTYLLFIILWPMQGQALAQEKYLDVFVTNADRSAVSGILITCAGSCSTELVSQGRARIALPSQTRPNDTIVLRLVRRSPRNPEWIIVSPQDGAVVVPSFGTRTTSAVSVVVAMRVATRALSSNKVRDIVEKTLRRAQTLDGQVSEREFDLALKMQAKANGMTTEEVTLAIHEWATKAKDPYDKGLAALFDKKYAEATSSLTASYELRKKGAEDFADAAYFLGQSLWHQGKYREAVEKFQEVNAFRKNDPAVLIMLGLSLSYAGKNAEAEAIYRQDLPLVEQEFGKDSVEVGVILNNIGLACRLQDKLAEAETLYNEALAINREKLGDEAPLTANTLNNLGILFIDKKNYVEAERLLKEALSIRDKKLGRDHPDTAITVDNLGFVYGLQGKYEEAEPLLKQALDIKEKTFGYEHPITANSYGHLAALYSTQGRYSEATPMYEKWIAIQEKLVRDESPITTTILNNIGVAYHKQDKYIEAERYYKRAIDICEKTNSNSCDMTYRNLGKLYTAKGKYVEAEPLFQRALAIFEKGPAELNVRIVFVLESYAELLRKTNREEKATALETRAKEIRTKAGFYGKN